MRLYGMDIFSKCFPFKKSLVQEITHVLKVGGGVMKRGMEKWRGEGGRERGRKREGGREEWREGGKEGRREGRKEGGREGGRD